MDHMVEKAIGGALVVVLLYVVYWAIRFFWRVAKGTAKKVADAAPATLEKTARLAGSATAAAEKQAANAVKAFKEGRSNK